MLKCPLCQLDYSTEGEQQPRLLVGCGHTFCQKCIENIPDKDPLACPQCSLVSTDPHVPNITIMTYVDIKQASSRPPPVIHHVPAPVNVICQDCKKTTATLLCFQCLPSGFKFCESCSTREHGRSFGPMVRHRPQPISEVRISTPVPSCRRHPNQPCLFFSFKVNAFACELCRETLDFVQDEYISIDVAVAQIREEVPGLIELLRERVKIMAKTRSELDLLLTRVDQEKNRALERIHIEFNEFEMAMRKRMNSVLLSIEHEAKFQSKTLLQQQERLEIAQGNADTAIVRANWLLQMGDYTYIHQADSVISSMKGQLSDEEFPMYHNPTTTGEIPIHLPPDFMDQIEKLGIIGGGSVPTHLKSFVRDGLLYISWEQSDPGVTQYEISYKDSTDPLSLVSSGSIDKFPISVTQAGNSNEKRIDAVMIGTKYLFHVRARNLAGWGVWSYPVVGSIDGFPLEIGYTGEIVEIVLPKDGVYFITACGAKAADGALRKGGKGAIIGARFLFKKHDSLIILCGGMSTMVGSSSGGGGGTFVALNKRRDILLVAGGGGGTRGYEEEDLDGTDATTSESGRDGIGNQWGSGGAGGGAGKDAVNVSAPSWGNGGAGFTAASTTAKSFLHGGEAGEGGGFGGGGAVGHFGGGGGGGYSGGGGGRGGGGGGSFIKEEGDEQVKEVGNEGYGLVKIDFLQESIA